MNRKGTGHSYRTRCCLKDWREGVSDGETCTTVVYACLCYAAFKNCFSGLDLLYILEFIKHLTTRNNPHQPLADGRDTTQAGCVMEWLRVYISDAVYNAMYPQLSSRLVEKANLCPMLKRKRKEIWALKEI